MGGVDQEAQSESRLMRRLAITALGFFLLIVGIAQADDYPTRPITLVVPFPAGGGVDSVGRIVAEKLSVALGQQVVIDNRGGAAGVIGTRAVTKSPPDGYTLVMATSGSIAINPNLYVNAGYQTLKDLVPIGLITSTSLVLIANPSRS